MIQKEYLILLVIAIAGIAAVIYLAGNAKDPTCYTGQDCIKFICCRTGYCISNISLAAKPPSCSPVCSEPPPTEEFSCSCENLQCVKHTTVSSPDIPYAG